MYNDLMLLESVWIPWIVAPPWVKILVDRIQLEWLSMNRYADHINGIHFGQNE